MDVAYALEVGRQGFIVSLLITLPILSMALFVGLSVSVMQAMTQVQEMTLTFVPKMIGAGVIILTMGSWMISTLVKFTLFCFDIAAKAGQI